VNAVLTAAAVLGPRGAVHVAGFAVFVGVETSCDSTGWEYGLYVTVQYSTVESSIIWYVTVQCSTVQLL
jgi:hypothetical protein